ncbi:DUF2764 family protein [Ancylomarina sp. 16SWW S1-10-2]|uniref:DUF2764 family protein n=1 Tax=Ancylomarina sp. 16SWW S1-10-2 TaxID=2499681 RepID=UPI0012AD6006|nr:DUF2764 family protein [Ancylomarina sp. 16SWW S1-10-2]MRT92963.1 DUF2764 family protein [Ancylomarina sp. 16SWW S1-10-2]
MLTVYLTCSLPTLYYNQIAPITLSEFYEEASSQLSIKNFEKLKQTDLQQVNARSLQARMNSFWELNESLKADVAEIRKVRQSKQLPNVHTLPKSFADKNPLEREKSLLKIQWDALTDLEFGETFSFTGVLVYKLKLQILERLASFDAKKGRLVLESIVNPAKEKEMV